MSMPSPIAQFRPRLPSLHSSPSTKEYIEMPTLKPSKKGLEYFAQEEKKEENEPYASTNQNLAIIQKKYSELYGFH